MQNIPIKESDTQEVDLFVDFSTPQAVLPNLKRLMSFGKSVIIGTTGWDFESVKHQKEIGLFYASNFSLGIHLFSIVLKKAVEMLPSHYKAAVYEEHHDQKLDAPSGTAKNFLEILPEKTPVASLRLGDIVGNHEVIFDSPFDQIRLSHHAKSREMYAIGAIKAAEWLQGKKGTFTMEDLLK